MADGKKISELTESATIEDAHYFAVSDGTDTTKVAYSTIKNDLIDYSEELAEVISPTVTPTEIEGGVRLTITDIEGTKTANILNGAPNNQDYVRWFDTVADMQAAIDLQEGMTCHTNGFHAAGDGGAGYYTISASGTANNCTVLACGNLRAVRVFDGERAALESLNYQNVSFSTIAAAIVAAGVKVLTARSVSVSESIVITDFDFMFDELTYTGSDHAIILDGVRHHQVVGNVLTCANGSGVKVTCTTSGCTDNTIKIASIDAATHGISILPVNGRGVAYNKYEIGRIVAGNTGIRSYIAADTGYYSWQGEELFSVQNIEATTGVSFVIDSPSNGKVTDGTITGITFTNLAVEGSTYGVVCNCGTVNADNTNAGIKSIIIYNMRCREYGRTTKFLQTSGYIRDLYIKPTSNIQLSQWELRTTATRTCVIDATIFNYGVNHDVGSVLCAESGVTYIKERCNSVMYVDGDIDFADMALNASELYMPRMFRVRSSSVGDVSINLAYFYGDSAQDLLFSILEGHKVTVTFPNGSAKAITNGGSSRATFSVSCMRTNNEELTNYYVIRNLGSYTS